MSILFTPTANGTEKHTISRDGVTFTFSSSFTFTFIKSAEPLGMLREILRISNSITVLSGG